MSCGAGVLPASSLPCAGIPVLVGDRTGRGSRRVRGEGMLGFTGHQQKWKDNPQNARRFLQILLSDQGRVSREYVTEHMFLPKESRTQAGHPEPDPLWAACIVTVRKGPEPLHPRPPARGGS